MATYLDQYFEAVEALLGQVRETQRPAIAAAASAIADSLAARGAWAVMDTGHMLRHEAFMRAGGLVALTPFAYELQVDTPIARRAGDGSAEKTASLEAKTVEAALDASRLARGDVLLINSNSGRTANVIEVALQCQARGITTIALCSKQQMDHCDAAHPSGKKLFDVADICIDNGGPHGDALIDVKDNERMCPGSGLAGTYVLWAIQAEVVEQLQARDVNPTIFRSVHVGGHAFVEEQQRRFAERGV